MPNEEDFESIVGKWLEELIKSVQSDPDWPLRLRREQTMKGDSGNNHRIDFVIEGVGRPKNLNELLSAVRESKGKDSITAVNRLIESFRYDPKILVEVKGMGFRGEKPTEQTYREHMLRAYAYLGDFRKQIDKQKYVIVSYKIAKHRRFDYESYLSSIDVHLLDYNNPKERSALEDRIRKLEEEG